MKRAVKGLDHVVVMVDGIDTAEAAYRKLGFQVQPRGFHTKLGTANQLMIFDKDYFEILGIVEPTSFNAERREWLKGGGGLANVALSAEVPDSADGVYDLVHTMLVLQHIPVAEGQRISSASQSGRTVKAAAHKSTAASSPSAAALSAALTSLSVVLVLRIATRSTTETSGVGTRIE